MTGVKTCALPILLKDLQKISSNLNINLIINKFEDDIKIDVNKIKNISTLKNVITIPYSKEVISNCFLGNINILKTNDNNYINSINNFINYLLEKTR